MEWCAIARWTAVALLPVWWIGSPVAYGDAGAARTISGRVVSPDGKPVVNATVYCSAGIPNRFPTVTARSDVDGQFAMTVPPASVFVSPPDSLWAFATGYSVAVSAMPDTDKQRTSVRLVLGAPSPLRVHVALPDGASAQSATVLVQAIGTKSKEFCPPDALARRAASTTDEAGVAVVSAWRYQEVKRVDIVLPSFGRQMCYAYDTWTNERRPQTWKIGLMRAGTLRGRVVADGPYAVGGLPVQIVARSVPDRYPEYPHAPPSPMVMQSEATVTTDSDGCFQVPELAGKWLDMEIVNGINKPYQYPVGRPTEFHPGDSREVVLRLRKAVRVHGTFRLLASDARPSDFRIRGYTPDALPEQLNNFLLVSFFANIDEKGHFEFYSLPGKVGLWVDDRKQPEADTIRGWSWMGPEVGRNYYRLFGRRWSCRDTRKDIVFGVRFPWCFTVPSGVDAFESPGIELCEVRGRVVTAKGMPIPNVTVGFTQGRDLLRTNEEGRFHLWLDPKHDCELVFNGGPYAAIYGSEQVTYRLLPGDAKGHGPLTMPWSMQKYPNGRMLDVVLPPCGEKPSESRGTKP